MVNINERNGVITLIAKDYDLKIDNNRVIYIKKKAELSFRSVNSEVQHGLSIDEKKKYIYDFYEAIEKRRREIIEEKEENHEQNSNTY